MQGESEEAILLSLEGLWGQGGHWGGETWVPPGGDVGGPGGSCRRRIRSRNRQPDPLGSSARGVTCGGL